MGYFIALIPPLLDSIGIYLDKFLLSKYDVNSTIITLYSGFFAFFASILILLFTGFSHDDIKTILILLASGFFGVFYLFSYLKALTYDEGSRVGSLFQFVPVLVLFLSFIFLGEKLQIKQYLGSLIIIIAGFSLSLQKAEVGLLKIKINKAFWYMLLSCTLSALVYVSFKLGVKQVGFWGTLPYEGLGSGLATLCILGYRDNLKLLRNTRKSFKPKALLYMTLVEFEYRISRYILFFALTLIPASIASILMGFQSLFLFIIGLVLSLKFPHLVKEVVTKRTIGLKIIATACFLIGLYLILL